MSDECDNCAAKGQGGPFCQSCLYGGNNEYHSVPDTPLETANSILLSISLPLGLVLSGWFWWKLKVWGIVNIFYVFHKRALYGATEPELSLGMLIFLVLLAGVCLFICPIIIFLIGKTITKRIWPE